MDSNEIKDVPKWLWLWMPIAIALFPYVMRMIDPATDNIVFGELGIIENITVILLLFAIFFAARTLTKLHTLGMPALKFWIGLLMLGCIYYAGEELSWGQHWIGWDTPEAWQNVNDQGETNLHNTSALLDQVPRTILTIAAVVGGIIAPLFIRARGIRFSRDDFFYWWWPTYVNIPCCAAALFVSLHEKIYKLFGTTVPHVLDIRAGETKECLLAMFLFMYVVSFYQRLKAANTLS